MAIPDYQEIMLPLLKLVSDGQEHALRELISKLTSEFRLTAEESQQLLPSGNQEVFVNRVGWARTYMKKAGLLQNVRRGVFRITERGKDVLKREPTRIDNELLEQFEEFRAFKALRHTEASSGAPPVPEEVRTPEEGLEDSYRNLQVELAAELLERIKASPPSMFERIVVDLLVKMGYGGTRLDAGRAVGKGPDEGIDGVIKEDRLGLDAIYLQAKRWEATVGRPEIQKFAGALQGQRARKGVFITTSDFSQEALNYVQMIESKIILLNGQQLAEFMIEYGVGVTPVSTYVISRIDSDYFEGD
jgi:restriction system protein